MGQFGLTLAVGASTFALIFYYVAIQDGIIDASEKRFMHVVYRVLRVGLVLIIVTELCLALFHYMQDGFLFFKNEFLLFTWTVLAVIVCNAILMQKHKMPMWLGPALAGGSWYTLALVHAFPPAALSSYTTLGVYYVTFVALMVVALKIIKMVYSKK
ncbi:MAG: hypothetical protein WD153_02425 [Candidatus Paceibacterota bacterium]